MTSFEKSEIRRLPKKYRPIGALGYLWLSIVYSIPVLGTILAIIHSVSDRKICRRSFARSILLIYIVSIILAVALIALGIFNMEQFQEITNQLPSDM